MISTYGVHTLGRSGDMLRMNKQEHAYYLEYGLRDNFTLIGRLGLQDLTQTRRDRASQSKIGPSRSGFLTQTTQGAGGIEMGARFQLAEYKSWVISTQASIGIPGAGENTTNLKFGEGGGDIDLRLMAGRGLLSNGFVSLNAGWRNRRGLQADEWRLDMAAGKTIYGQVQGLIQSYSVWSEPGGFSGQAQYQGHRVQLSFIIPLTQHSRLQIGNLQTVHADHMASEQAWIIGVWRKF